MLWNSQGSQDLAYAPWGNQNDGNATIVPFTVSSGMPSKNVPFTGMASWLCSGKKSPMKSKMMRNQYQLISKIRLPFSAEKPTDSLILLTPSTEGETWKTRNLSFDEKAIPKGHFTFSSQLNSPVGILFGKSKFTLARGKTETIKVIPKDTESQVMELSAYLPKNGKYEKVFSKKWPYSSDLRGLYFIGMQRNRIRVNRIVEFSLPIETTLGFGLPPVSNHAPDVQPESPGGGF